MKKTIKLTLNSGLDYTDKDRRIDLCRGGMARYFGVEPYEMEDTLWVTVSNKKFKGADPLFIDSDGHVTHEHLPDWMGYPPRDYIAQETRIFIARLLDIEIDKDTTIYVKFEVMK